ncbi:MAG: hemerythrin domain-containing protein [Desulfamplus sp.]|nr:hemerythrin domain-containing protein [Desulfamplus sp.]
MMDKKNVDQEKNKTVKERYLQQKNTKAMTKKYSNMDFRWKEQYNTGIAKIDNQHRYFLELIEIIAAQTNDNKDDISRDRLVMEFIHYAQFHFYSEENLMIRYKYPKLEEHQALHLDLIDLLTGEINSVFEEIDGYNKFIHFLLKWFVHHSMEEDKKIYLFLTEQKKIDDLVKKECPD